MSSSIADKKEQVGVVEEREREREREREKELTPYRPSEWSLETFQEKIHDPKFAQYAYQAHSMNQQLLEGSEFYGEVVQKFPKAIKQLNIWGDGSGSCDGCGGGGALTLKNVFENEEVLKETIRAILLGETVEYDECIKRLTECGTYLNQIGHYDEPDVTKLTEEGFLIEVAIQLYYQAVYVSDKHETTQNRLEHEWDETHRSKNKAAYEQILRHMPNNIHEIPSEQELIELLTSRSSNSTSGDDQGVVPKTIARRFFRKTILQILRTTIPAETLMDRVHPMWLEDRFVSNGLTLTEHRALQCYMRGLKLQFRDQLTFDGEELTPNTEQNIYKRKYQWLQALENNFKGALAKEEKSSKPEAIDYSGDYGYYDPNDDNDGANNTVDGEALDNLGDNDINSKMMKDWLDKPSSNNTNDESSKPMPPRLPMGNILLGIKKRVVDG